MRDDIVYEFNLLLLQGGMRVYTCDHDTSPPGLFIHHLKVFQHALAT